MIEIKEEIDKAEAKSNSNNTYAGDEINIVQNFRFLAKEKIELELLGMEVEGYLVLFIDEDVSTEKYCVGVCRNDNLHNPRSFEELDKAKNNFEDRANKPKQINL